MSETQTAERRGYWTPEDAAGFLKLTPAAVNRQCRLGKLPADKVVGKWRIRSWELEDAGFHLPDAGEDTLSSAAEPSPRVAQIQKVHELLAEAQLVLSKLES